MTDREEDKKPTPEKEVDDKNLDDVTGGTMGQRPTMPIPPPLP